MKFNKLIFAAVVSVLLLSGCKESPQEQAAHASKTFMGKALLLKTAIYRASADGVPTRELASTKLKSTLVVNKYVSEEAFTLPSGLGDTMGWSLSVKTDSAQQSRASGTNLVVLLTALGGVEANSKAELVCNEIEQAKKITLSGDVQEGCLNNGKQYVYFAILNLDTDNR